MLNALLATLLVLAGIGLLLYLVGLLFNAARPPLDGLISRRWEHWLVARSLARARRGDSLRERGDLEGALREFQAAFFLHPVHDRTLAATVANHHTGLLSRLIAITEEVQGGTVRLFALGKVDRLLNERSELQRRYFADRARARRHQLERQLHENRRELQAALSQLVGEITAARHPTRLH
ncbi:MAG: hypothetical protein HY699_25405 [Deltaproteobacteria bacterium]|nr:hypothetical protein [Deltaproteobacteria bacterium]